MTNSIITIYLIRCLANGKVYVGQTSKAFEERWRRHVNDALEGESGCPIFYRAIRKYGPENFEIRALCFAENCAEADFLEESFISRYDSTNPQKGYNIKPGGRTLIGFKFSSKSIAKMKASALRYWSNPEARLKKSKGMTGKANAAGKRTEEQRLRILAGSINRWANPEAHRKQSEALNKPGVPEKRSRALRAALAKPESRAKRIGNQNAAIQRKMNSSLQRGLELVGDIIQATNGSCEIVGTKN
jgi:group I intron endonuclease